MVRFNNISKNFGTNNIVHNASFTIEPGAVTAILGESGAGKTTILRMINGLETADSGNIMIDGEPLTKHNILQTRLKVGFVFQNFNLFPNMTAIENICLAPLRVLKWDRHIVLERADELLEKLQLKHVKNHYISQLSGGQKQRIAIIRAIIMEPKIIVLDEPTSALDPGMINQVGEVIEFLKSTKTTIVMVTHNAKFVRKYCSNVIFCSNNTTKQYSSEEFFATKDPSVVKYLEHE